MSGMDRTTGEEVAEGTDLHQSIGDILSTPIGTRVARRDYGSRVFILIDAPANAANQVLLYSAIATALLRWERRISLTRVDATPVNRAAGKWLVLLVGTVNRTGATFRLSLPLGGIT